MFDSIKRSLPTERKIHGQIVRRMPLGVYLSALQTLQDFPQDIAMRLLPADGDIGVALKQLQQLDRGKMVELLLKALTVIPERAVALVSELTAIPTDILLNDPAIGLDGLAEIVDAWLEVNGAENFSRAARRAGKTITAIAATLKPGYSA